MAIMLKMFIVVAERKSASTAPTAPSGSVSMTVSG
jgi:hypothetical protein